MGSLWSNWGCCYLLGCCNAKAATHAQCAQPRPRNPPPHMLPVLGQEGDTCGWVIDWMSECVRGWVSELVSEWVMVLLCCLGKTALLQENWGAWGKHWAVTKGRLHHFRTNALLLGDSCTAPRHMRCCWGTAALLQDTCAASRSNCLMLQDTCACVALRARRCCLGMAAGPCPHDGLWAGEGADRHRDQDLHRHHQVGGEEKRTAT